MISNSYMNILDYKNYRFYLRDRLNSEKKSRSNVKSLFADYVSCQASYLSQVLAEKTNLTLEQAVLANEFLAHSQFEARLFILLVEKERAGSKKLEQHFQQQIDWIISEQNHLKKRFQSTGQVPEEYQKLYYSTWYYSAIHLLLAIPQYSDLNLMAARLNLPLNEVTKVVNDLLASGLIYKEGEQYLFSQEKVYLGRDEISVKHHHINWRSQALQAVERNSSDNLHYSMVVAISENDYEKIKKILLAAVDKTREVTGPSKEETVAAILIDVFKVG